MIQCQYHLIIKPFHFKYFLATYLEHINQANKNLSFLDQINFNIDDCWDWQVTVCFYVSVHLVNAHIADKTDQHYRSHEQVKEALNPYNVLSASKLSEDVYKAFDKLQNLSRRSRYLCNDNIVDKNPKGFFTYDKHLCKALKQLDILLQFVNQHYGEEFKKLYVNCIEIKNANLKYFEFRT